MALDIAFPVPFTTIQVVGIQHLAGRGHHYVRCFGYRTADPNRQIVEVALDPNDAVEIIELADKKKQFPEIEIPSRSIISILNTDGLNLIHIGEVGEPPPLPRRGA